MLPRSRRTPTGHRRYGQEDLARVLRLRQARDQGLSLPQIRELLQADGATPPAAAPT
ncbi:MerR family transcriptional regulator [Paraburkholderia sp. SIMBA_054]|uniref:MerR family transcriptional regulator n=1 Tax=Paraburkholderia sp. SIMBA_054 TaxID=3085795 RepID=UPI00397E8150